MSNNLWSIGHLHVAVSINYIAVLQKPSAVDESNSSFPICRPHLCLRIMTIEGNVLLVEYNEFGEPRRQHQLLAVFDTV